MGLVMPSKCSQYVADPNSEPSLNRSHGGQRYYSGTAIVTAQEHNTDVVHTELRKRSHMLSALPTGKVRSSPPFDVFIICRMAHWYLPARRRQG